MKRLAAASLVLLASNAALFAQGQPVPDKYSITETERAACTMDAIRFCSGTYPNEDRLLACMRRNRASLSTSCRVAFDEGLRRRRL